MLNDVMIDIETLSKRHDAAILSIGAVLFDPVSGEIGEKFYVVVQPENHPDYGHIDPQTVMWWMGKSDEARKLITEDKGKQLLNEALYRLIEFIDDNCDRETVKVWAKSPVFDLTILKNAFDRHVWDIPWNFRNEMDVRTVLAIREIITYAENISREGIKHSALDDANFQALQVSEFYSFLHKMTA